MYVETASLQVKNAAQLFTSTFGTGKAGDVHVEAATLQVKNAATLSTSGSGTGTRGNLMLKADQFEILDGGNVLASGGSSAPVTAKIEIEATTLRIKNDAKLQAQTAGGNMAVRVTQLEILDGGTLLALSTSNMQAGDVTVTGDQVLISAGNKQGCCTGIRGQVGTPGLPTSGRGGGGLLRVTANNFTIVGTPNGSAEISATAFGEGPGGILDVNVAGLLSINGGMPLPTSSPSSLRTGIFSDTSSAGRGATMHMAAGSLQLTDQAMIQTRTMGPGPGGDAIIEVKGSLDLGEGTLIATDSMSGNSVITTGNGGNLDIRAGDISISGSLNPLIFPTPFTGFRTSTFGGVGGTLSVQADTFHMTNKAQIVSTNGLLSPSGAGDLGNISLQVGTLSITDGAMISSENLNFSAGHPGTISVQGTGGVGSLADRVEISGRSSLDRTPSGITVFNHASFGFDTRTGQINVAARSLSMTEGAEIRSKTFSFYTPGAPIVASADSLLLTNGARLISDSVGGQAGAISITAPGFVTLSGVESPKLSSGFEYSTGQVAGIYSSSGDSGAVGGLHLPSGTISVSTGVLTLTGGAIIESGPPSFFLQGGTVELTATNSIVIREGSRVSSTATFTDTDGIVVTTPSLTMDNGLIATNSFGTAKTGPILVNVGRLSLTNGGAIGSGAVGFDQFSASPSAGSPIAIRGLGGIGTEADLVTIAGKNTDGLPSGLFSLTGRTFLPGIQFFPTNDSTRAAGGDISVQARTLSVSEGGAIFAATLSTSPMATGGSVTIDADQVLLTTGGSITAGSALPFGQAPSGTVTLNASESFRMMGQDNVITAMGTSTAGAGDAGPVRITSPLVEVTKGSISTESNGAGNAGAISLAVGRLILQDGTIETNPSGSGHGGDVSVLASESVQITRITAENSGIGTSSLGTGKAGDIDIQTPLLSVQEGSIEASAVQGNGGNISLSVGQLSLIGGASIDSSTIGAGQGGAVAVAATEKVTISGLDRDGLPGGIGSVTLGGGAAGQVYVKAPLLELDQGGVFSSTAGAGHGGSINLEVGRLVMTNGAVVDASTLSDSTGHAGDAIITAEDSISVSGFGRIQSISLGGGNGGQVSVSTPTLSLDSSSILADTFGTGTGGAIHVNANRIDLFYGSAVSADSNGLGRAEVLSIGV